MSLLTELKDSLLSGDFDDIRNALTMQNLIEQVHNLGSTDFSLSCFLADTDSSLCYFAPRN